MAKGGRIIFIPERRTLKTKVEIHQEEGWYELSKGQKREQHKAQQENHLQQSLQGGPDKCELTRKLLLLRILM